MEELKAVLREHKDIDKVYVTDNGAWYFGKPENIETAEYGRDEILGDEKVISPLANAKTDQDKVIETGNESGSDKDKAVAGNAQKRKDEDKK